MQSKLHLSSNQNVARIAAPEVDSGSSREVPALIAAPDTKASARIRQLRELAENILLAEDAGELTIIGAVVETLRQVQLELNECEGLQLLYEGWVENGQ